nr:hypothetical protein XYFPCFBP8417_04575 [Xylella fastidiosa subsp. multiplex]
MVPVKLSGKLWFFWRFHDRYFMVVTLAHRFSAVSTGALIFTIGDPSVLEAVQREAFFLCDRSSIKF